MVNQRLLTGSWNKTETVSSREMQAQLLDSIDSERERGITIKLNAIELNYKAKDGET